MNSRPVPRERVPYRIIELRHTAAGYEAAAVTVESDHTEPDHRATFVTIATELRRQAQYYIDEAAALQRWLDAQEATT